MIPFTFSRYSTEVDCTVLNIVPIGRFFVRFFVCFVLYVCLFVVFLKLAVTSTPFSVQLYQLKVKVN